MVTWLSFGLPMRGGLFDMVDMVESTSIVVLADTPTCRVISRDDIFFYGGAVTVETCHMTVNVITQLSGQKVAEGGKFGRLDSLGCLDTDGGRHEHAMNDAAWGIGSERPHAANLGFIQ
jgi:hypothetical protein